MIVVSSRSFSRGVRPGFTVEFIGEVPMSLGPPNGLIRVAAPAPNPLAFSIHGPIARADLPGLCDRVCALLEGSDARVALCDVRGVDPDAVTVDALARLQLAARRHGCQVRLRYASDELLELVDFMGLTDVLAD
jgi:ABC-type transporter Mla MlaB component